MRQHWDGRRAVAVALGGAAGAATRWVAVASFSGSGFPWPVFLVNVVGSLVLGLLLAEEWSHPRARVLLHDAGAIGFCGGLTTFSTFALEVVELARDGSTALAAWYGLASVAAALAGVVAGAGALRRVRAVARPVEEEP